MRLVSVSENEFNWIKSWTFETNSRKYTDSNHSCYLPRNCLKILANTDKDCLVLVVEDNILKPKKYIFDSNQFEDLEFNPDWHPKNKLYPKYGKKFKIEYLNALLGCIVISNVSTKIIPKIETKFFINIDAEIFIYGQEVICLKIWNPKITDEEVEYALSSPDQFLNKRYNFTKIYYYRNLLYEHYLRANKYRPRRVFEYLELIMPEIMAKSVPNIFTNYLEEQIAVQFNDQICNVSSKSLYSLGSPLIQTLVENRSGTEAILIDMKYKNFYKLFISHFRANEYKILRLLDYLGSIYFKLKVRNLRRKIYETLTVNNYFELDQIYLELL